jgi:hypothetical protein
MKVPNIQCDAGKQHRLVRYMSSFNQTVVWQWWMCLLVAWNVWAQNSVLAEEISELQNHWAFQPIAQVKPLASPKSDWTQTPLDHFVIEKLEANGLSPSPKASRRVLVRRMYLNLTGLLPTFDEVQLFEKDKRPDAFDRLIEKLLADPSYGKKWGRHWLDVARYADAKGYVDAGEPTNPFAYTYRDYVIDAFNQDKPYDQFILEQIAADRLDNAYETPSVLAGLGFLTVGSRFNFFPHEIIDDRIDVVTRGFLGLTVACARCHDHKYDPVSAGDYYSLYGIFANSQEPTPDTFPVLDHSDLNAEKPWAKEVKEAADKYRKLRKDQHQRVMFEMRAWAGDYLNYVVQSTPRHRTKDQPELLTQRGLVREVSAYSNGAVRHWRKFLENQTVDDPVFGLWASLFKLDLSSIPSQFPERLKQFLANPDSNQHVKEAFKGKSVQSMSDVAEVYSTLLEGVDQKWREALKLNSGLQALEDSDEEQIRQKLYGPESPASISIDETIDYLTLDESVAIRKHFADIERVFLKHWRKASPRPMIMKDRKHVLTTHIFKRGDPHSPGEVAPRVIPALLRAGNLTPIESGSGRLELARAIAHSENSLTARVIVNRIWGWHFGSPLVDTPSDFGMRSQAPRHSELLDYLAAAFIKSGRSIKQLHRLILRSATWQQASVDRPECRELDPENRLFWRMNRRRLTFESSRDSMLQVADQLQELPGGPPVRQSPDDPANKVRTIYNYIDRENLEDVFRVFDFPSPDISAPHRAQTTVPQQSLFLLNSPFVIAQAAAILRSLPLSVQDKLQLKQTQSNLTYLFQKVYQRQPASEEMESLVNYLIDRETDTDNGLDSRWREIAQTLLLSNEFQFMD